MEYPKDIIVADKLGVVRTDSEKEYLAHLLCLGGTCRYRFNERDFELHAAKQLRYERIAGSVPQSRDAPYAGAANRLPPGF